MLLALAIVIADLAQPLLLPWRPKFVGALGGAAIYTLVALGAWRGWRPTAWLAALMPVVPLTTLGLHLAGVELPAQPDGAMVAILALQLAVALRAGARLRVRPAATTGRSAPQ